MADTTVPPNASRLMIVLAFAALYIIWGSTYLAIKYAIETLPPFLFAGTRFLVAGAVMYAWARLSGSGRASGRQWGASALVGGLLLLGGNGGVVVAQQRVPSALAALLVAMMPLWMVVLNALRPGGSWPVPRVIGGVLLGIAGLLLLVGPGVFASTGRIDPVGAAILVLASLSWASGSLYSRGADLPSSPVLATGMQMLAGGALLAVVGVASGEASRIGATEISTRSAFALLYLIVFGSIVAYTAYVWLLRVVQPAQVATYAYVNPVVAVVLGWAIGGEAISSRMLFAGAIIVAAVVIITTAPTRARDEAVPVAPRPPCDEEKALAST